MLQDSKMTRNSVTSIDSRMAVQCLGEYNAVLSCNEMTVLFKYFKWLYSYLASRKQSQL